jgi:hypothetical protein
MSIISKGKILVFSKNIHIKWSIFSGPYSRLLKPIIRSKIDPKITHNPLGRAAIFLPDNVEFLLIYII